MHYLVVGGTSGIGLQVVRDLVDSGSEVTVWARRAEPEFDREGVHYVQVDVTEDLPGDLEVPKSLDGLVYCPGSINLAAFRQLKPETFASDFDVNVVGAVRVLHATLGALSAENGAGVVFLATTASRIGMNFHASVSAAKTALIGLAKSLAAEYAAKGVRFNVVAPSLTDTPMAERLLNNDKKRERAAERHPLKRVGTPSDIAGAVEYFLDPNAAWVTGQVLAVDGGISEISGL